MSLSAGDLFFAFLSANLPSAACADSLLIAALPCLVIEGRRFGVSSQAVHVILSSWKSPTVLFPVELLSGAIVCSFCMSGTLTLIFFTRNFQLSSVAKAIALALQTAALLDSCVACLDRKDGLVDCILCRPPQGRAVATDVVGQANGPSSNDRKRDCQQTRPWFISVAARKCG